MRRLDSSVRGRRTSRQEAVNQDNSERKAQLAESPARRDVVFDFHGWRLTFSGDYVHDVEHFDLPIWAIPFRIQVQDDDSDRRNYDDGIFPQ